MNWREFFDEVYLDFMAHYRDEEASRREALFVAERLGIGPGRRFLDLACGHGRHMAHMPKDTVVGLDVNVRYLQLAKRHGDVVAGDARMPPFRRGAFHGAYIMHSTLGMFGEEGDMEILTWLSGAVKAGGRLLIDLANKEKVEDIYATLGEEWNFWISAGPYRVLAHASYNPLASVVSEVRYIYRAGEYLGERRLELRLYGLGEVRIMLGAVGFTVEEAYGDLAGGPLRRSSDRLVVVAVKTGGISKALKEATGWV